MASIQTAIELYDSLTTPMMNIINAINMGVSSMYEMNEAMNNPIDTASFDVARENISRAEIAVRELDNAIQKVSGSNIEINAPSVTAPVEVPFKWQSYSGLEVFTNTGVERFEQELSSVNSMLEQLNDDQFKITMASNDTDILSPDAAYDIRSVEGRVQSLIEMIRQVEGTSLDIGTDETNANLEKLRAALFETINLENRLKESMQGADLSEVNSAFMKLSENVTHTEKLVRDTFSEIEILPVEVPFKWQTDNTEIFTNTGIDRFQQEVQSTNSMLDQLANAQTQITQQAASLDIIPPEAVTDIQGLQSRIQELQASIELFEQNSLDIESDEASAKLERLRIQLAQVTDYQENLNLAMGEMDVGDINEAYLRLSQTVGNVERSVRDSFSKPVEIPITWNSDNLEVFTNTGVDRFKQEISSANQMMNTLNQTQIRIVQTAMQTDLFPTSSVTDMSNIQKRLAAIQRQIQTIENNPLNIGSDTANAELEHLRSQLSQAVSQQENLNRAVENMDVEGANQAYLHLFQTIGNTEKYIRDNVDEQGDFNREIERGTNEADQLMQTIKGAVAAYASIQTVGKIIDLSDTMTQTTARLDLIVDDGGSVEELQNKIYASAQNARGSYQATADAVSKLGLMAGDAFSSTDEIVSFMEQINKQFTIAGTEASGIDAAMLQLTQAMSSGVLRGEEFNSIMEQAPNIIQSIADYMGVTKGQLKDMAAEGQITSDIVKNAMFAAADETNAKFASMPMTFSQIWTSFENTALMAFQPVLQQISDIANSEAFQNFVDSAVNALAVLAGIVTRVFNLMITAAKFIANNWSWISPIVYGIVAALVVYYGWQLLCAAGSAIMNAAMALLSANPIVLIILAIVALIAIIYKVCSSIANMTGIANSGFGVICGGVNVVIQFFKNLGLSVANIALGIWEALGALCSNFMTAFHNAICSVQSWWYDLLSTCMTVIKKICEYLNKLPFVEFDYSGITEAADDYASKAAAAAGNKEEYESVSGAFKNGFNTFDVYKDGWVSEAFDSGSAWGDNGSSIIN